MEHLASSPLGQMLVNSIPYRKRPVFSRNEVFRLTLDASGEWFLVQARYRKTYNQNVDDPDGLWPGNPHSIAKIQKIVPEFKTPANRAADCVMVAATDVTAVCLKVWCPDNLHFANEEALLAFQHLILKFHSEDQAMRMRREWEQNKTLPQSDWWNEHPQWPLSEYQRVATITNLHRSGALFMEQGTGKTPCVIQRICMESEIKHARAADCGEKDRVYRALIVCPNQVRTNWMNEVEKFATTSGRVTVIRGSKLRRAELIVDALSNIEDDERYSIIIIGYDTVPLTMDFLKMLPLDLIVADESHRIKSKATRRWKALRELRNNAKNGMILTGTPIANKPWDVWSQLEFCEPGSSGFITFSRFKAFYGKFIKNKNHQTTLVELKNMPFFKERLARMAFRITKKAANLQLPDKLYDIQEVAMTPRQREAYLDLQTKLIVAAEEMLDKAEAEGQDKVVTVNNILTMMLRLAQITSGHIKWDDEVDLDGNVVRRGAVEQIATPNPKVDAIMQDAKELPSDEKMVIWATFREDIRVLSEALTEEGLEHGCYFGDTSDAKREEYVHRFNNDPSFRFLVCNPSSAGEGLNLLGYNPNVPEPIDTNCSMFAIMSQDWSMVKRSQLEDRGHRRGCRVPLRIRDYLVVGTIDQEIRDRVQGKLEMARSLQDVREIMMALRDRVPEED
jgi:SWI/SNF-related matrix-associated actin-dependent regulator 1 of chromatin subfamily A